MRRFFSLLLILFVTFGLVMSDAQAKRFGGGRSFGVQRSVSSFSRVNSAPSMQTFGQRSPQPNKWLGPILGLAAGGLLASLFMGHGLGSGLFSWFIIAILIFFVLKLLRRPQMAMQSNNYHDLNENSMQSQPAYDNVNSHSNAGFHSDAAYPADFDAATFIREAKVQFIRLQAAYDQKNLNDLRQFTTPEVFAEIQLQFQERGNEENQTEVVSLDAQLLNAINESQIVTNSIIQTTVASIRFTGLIREDLNKPAAFNEIWHFKKDSNQSQWLVAGIQQN